MNAGDVFRFEGIADIHVWMIISDPSRDPQHVVFVNFTTWAPEHDQTCIVEPGDHPFIVHRTIVNYPQARVATDAVLEQLRDKGRLTLLPPLSAALLRRVRNGAVDTVRMPVALAEIIYTLLDENDESF